MNYVTTHNNYTNNNVLLYRDRKSKEKSMHLKNDTILSQQELDQLSINTIRFLFVDAMQKANSGHPGLPLGAASMAYVLWTKFLQHNPSNPHWFNRDRLVLFAGHGCILFF